MQKDNSIPIKQRFAEIEVTNFLKEQTLNLTEWVEMLAVNSVNYIKVI